jgi:itaconyl-CoA hydratase/mesaconyl-C4 CoA hydratase
LWHWCFFQEPVGEPALGIDGHPQRGGFLPEADDNDLAKLTELKDD